MGRRKSTNRTYGSVAGPKNAEERRNWAEVFRVAVHSSGDWSRKSVQLLSHVHEWLRDYCKFKMPRHGFSPDKLDDVFDAALDCLRQYFESDRFALDQPNEYYVKQTRCYVFFAARDGMKAVRSRESKTLISAAEQGRLGVRRQDEKKTLQDELIDAWDLDIQKETLRECIRDLDAKKRATVELYLNARRNVDIAAMLKTSPQNISQRLRRAIEELKECFRRKGRLP